jgi:hypothetical protein
MSQGLLCTQRLARCPADVFFVQYWAEVDDSVMQQLEQLMVAKVAFRAESIDPKDAAAHAARTMKPCQFKPSR